jgi:hypothetical protein
MNLLKSFMSFLRGSKKALGVIPWLDHGIQKITYYIRCFSVFNWTPWSSHGVTMKNNILVLSISSFLLCNCSAKQNNTIPSLPLPTTWNNYSLEQNNNTSSKWWL